MSAFPQIIRDNHVTVYLSIKIFQISDSFQNLRSEKKTQIPWSVFLQNQKSLLFFFPSYSTSLPKFNHSVVLSVCTRYSPFEDDFFSLEENFSFLDLNQINHHVLHHRVCHHAWSLWSLIDTNKISVHIGFRHHLLSFCYSSWIYR